MRSEEERAEAIRTIYIKKCGKYKKEELDKRLRDILLEEAISEVWFSDYTREVLNKSDR